MFRHKPHIVVAITTTDLDALRVSLPPLRRVARGAVVVIYNNNLGEKLTRRIVRALHPRGKIYIINPEKNLGELESHIDMVEFIRDKKIPCDWIMFVGATDILIDMNVPNVNRDTFAIVQNATTLSDSVTDVFKVSPAWTNGAPIGKTGPHFEINGTLIRSSIIFEFMDFLRTILPDVNDLLTHARYRVPASPLIWAGINTFVRTRHPEMSPIYMNRTNLVVIKLGRDDTRGLIPQKTIASTIKKFTKMIEIATTQNMVAEK